jgi:hypothetical protein
VVDQLLPQLLVLGADLNVAVALRPLPAQPKPHADVVREADFLALGADDEFVALGIVDT